MNLLKAFLATLFSKGNKLQNTAAISIYDLTINALNGDPINLSTYKGNYILFVNVASECGFTSQYKDLQKLYNTHKEKLQIISVPCNQFGNQEPGNANDIKTFCEVNYGVSFLITEKVDVKGKNQHPIYAWLTQKSKNGRTDSKVKWNFQKYLVDPNGNLIDYYYSITNPLSPKITKHLK
ncbi:glutathione peroxidase [Flavivirga jejuensis]|uniref:Glutathione peroxidase n=1 Tax=Flavivirga jejuensis TaxID=870487 RepID=A0ABT8WU18_9FLAO|nr:glutathione peroxidase [Flavivirga jejuensis]MDO5976480.1 glutathione peroxidase [Flavivirga jejuensis]